MSCSSCATENPAGSKFCYRCGARLAVACPSCGTGNLPDAAFCNECGTKLTSAAPADEAASPRVSPAPVAERRIVSVLFADLVGFTTFADGRDAEETREVLSRYFDLSREVIGRYGGSVEKFIGDAVMAVWGAPVAREDDAERAVRAGLELVDAVRSIEPGIEARAAVLTGEAAVTLGAVGQGMVAGDLVNTASRLQSIAPAGAVLVGEATQRAASRAIAFEEVGEQTLKGKVAPVPAWRALRVVSERGGRNRSDALEAPFVGRDDELRLIKDLFHATSREKRARLVSVIGPAGIGKSRLAWEFLKYLDGLIETVWFHDGRSPAYGDGISFWALGEMVRRRAGLIETDEESMTRTKVAAMLAIHVPDAEERRWIEPALLALLGFESGVASDQLFAAWRTFFERLAATAPVVMVFEDLHYADSGLLDFIDHLLEWSRNVPMYVVTLARPDLVERRSDWGAGKRNFTSLYLESLPEPAMRELLAGLVPGLPQAAVSSIVARADGVPLYAVETVRMLVADGKLRLEGDLYVPTGDLTNLAVPDTLTALIAARLDALVPADRAVLQDAAVLGQSFTLLGLAAVSGADPLELEPRLRALAKREMLTLEADPRSPERGQYAFVQALIREVAYGTLAKRDRKARHLAAARFFEGLGSGELAGALAGHYLAAHANATGGPEAEALAGQARIALRAAAERATALGANDQAVAFLEQALTVISDPDERAATWIQVAGAAEAAAAFPVAERYLTEAIAWHAGQGSAEAAAAASAQLGRMLMFWGRVEPAIEHLERAIQAGHASDDVTAELWGQLARARMLHNENEQSIADADRALAAAATADVVPVIADALITKGTAMMGTARSREGVALLRGAHALAMAHGLTHSELRATNNLAIGIFLDTPLDGLKLVRGGLEQARRIGDRGWLLQLGRLCSDLSLGTGQWDEGLALLAELEQGSVPDEIAIHFAQSRAEIGALRGEPVEAERLLAAVDEMLSRITNPFSRANHLKVRSLVALARGQLDQAFDLAVEAAAESGEMRQRGAEQAAFIAACSRDVTRLRRAMALLDQVGPTGAVRRTAQSATSAGIAALEGRPGEALATYRRSLGSWRDLGLPWDEALCAIEMAVLLDPAEPEVRAASASAREILTQLGSRPLLERLDAAAEQRSGVHGGHADRDTAPADQATAGRS